METIIITRKEFKQSLIDEMIKQGYSFVKDDESLILAEQIQMDIIYDNHSLQYSAGNL